MPPHLLLVDPLGQNNLLQVMLMVLNELDQWEGSTAFASPTNVISALAFSFTVASASVAGGESTAFSSKVNCFSSRIWSLCCGIN